MTRAVLFAMGALYVAMCVGCDSFVGPTSGVVRFDDGTPVSSGSIEFRRLTDKERFASRITPEGAFQPANQDGEIGLPPGPYEVVVVQIVLTEDLAKEAHSHGNTVPRRYADYYTSGLKVDIDDGQTDPVEIVLQSH
ncbi:carboxypeptidase regulatory-like domain-containing protein [Stieleria sp. ICT_E10.1]|uniref:carboxypeptidase regulatory-like domain-containing protein n=1 Tax=Stieleria sedimenti TaxID=2976331 RepID=UPI0021806FE8|nr:carboxypeptidase regulatory-like domain-containing protein [Stieleria sedimenti]MCS7469475.1 carboxypeptidase regulatory-like domain-containing protein [Stieleria sedimenti]